MSDIIRDYFRLKKRLFVFVEKTFPNSVNTHDPWRLAQTFSETQLRQSETQRYNSPRLRALPCTFTFAGSRGWNLGFDLSSVSSSSSSSNLFLLSAGS